MRAQKAREGVYMEAAVLIGIVIALVAYKGSQTVSEGVAQMRVKREMDEIGKANLATLESLWGER